MNQSSLSAAEFKAALSLALVFLLRMLPLFMVLPILAIGDSSYAHATPELLGLALGINGLTQACLQIPFGMLSDRYGRKPVIAVGLLMFMAGSLVAAISGSVYGLILGRALQGAGAVSAASIALAADLSSEEARTKVMALIGASIGISFPLAFIIGPILFSSMGLNGLFYISAVSAVLAILVLWFLVPTPVIQKENTTPTLNTFLGLLKNTTLIRLNISILISHLILMANFVAIPITLRDVLAIPASDHSNIYIIVFLCSLLITVPMIMFGDKYKLAGKFFIGSIVLLFLSQLGLYSIAPNKINLILLMIVYFGAFNFLESYLPSEISKRAHPQQKGSALGIYSASQFIGIFSGGALGGWLYQYQGMQGVFIVNLSLAAIWLLLVLILPKLNTGIDQNTLEEETV